jgi:hypothetical protein
MGPAGPAGETVYRSGSRIKLQYLTSVDGARILHGYYDAQLDLLCEPALAADGIFRCLPIGDFAWVTPHYYSDSICSIPIAYATSTVDPLCPSARLYAVGNLSCGRKEYYSILADYSGPVYTISSPGGACISFSMDGLQYFEIGPPISPGTFAAFSTTVED